MPFYRGFDIPGDLGLTADGRDIAMVSGRDEIAQSIRVRAGIFKGSWRYDTNKGVPYFQEILVAGPSVELVRRRFYELILGTPGVTSVTRLTIRFDTAQQTVFVDFECIGAGQRINGVLDFVSATAI